MRTDTATSPLPSSAAQLCNDTAGALPVSEVAGIPFWMPPKKNQPGASDHARGEMSASEPEHGRRSFSLWQALWAPAEISRDTARRHGCYLQEPEMMDLVLFPLALVPGQLGAQTRTRIGHVLEKTLRYVCVCV